MAYKLTELSAVNVILSNIGQSPVTDLETPNPQAQMAKVILDEVSHAVQSEGWSFNVEHHYPFSPDNNGEILIADNVLSIDVLGPEEADTIIRNGKLYDKYNHTYTWTDDIEATVVWYFDFEDIPDVFRQYIAVRAANLFAGRSVGSAEAARYSEREESVLRAQCLEHETAQGDYNMLGDTFGRMRYPSYIPMNAVYRR